MKLSKIITLCTSVFAILAMAGCASVEGFPDRIDSEKDTLAALKSKYNIATIASHIDTPPANKTAIAYRNEVIAARMMITDMRFAEFQKDMFSQRSYLSVGGDTMKSVFNAAGALTTAGQTSQILSGLSGAFDAGDSSVNENVYHGETQIVVMSMMLARRAEVKARIHTQMSADIASYPLTVALSDLEDYYVAGSVPGALAAINAAAGEKQAAAEKKIATRTISLESQSKVRQAQATSVKPKLDSMTGDHARVLIAEFHPKLPSAATEHIKKISGGLPNFDNLSDARAKVITQHINDVLIDWDGIGDLMSEWVKRVDEVIK